MLEVGKKAPAFTLFNQDEEKISLSKIDATYTIIFFYPKDNTSGCTIEAKGFDKLRKYFAKLDTVVVGVSGGDVKSKQSFCNKQNLSLILLADTDAVVGKKYKVYGPKKFMGRSYEGYNRITYVLDSKKRVLKTFDKVKPATHPKEVLDYLTTREAE